MPKDRRRPLGHVEKIIRANGRTRIIGWTSAQSLCLSWPGGEVAGTPTMQRPDVARRLGLPLVCGFELDAPEGKRPLTLRVERPSGGQVEMPVSHPSDPPTPAARRRLRRAFVMDMLRAGPALIGFFTTRDADARTRVKRALGLEVIARGLPIDARYLCGEPVAGGTRPVTVIMPVYNAFDLLAEALRRVEENTDLDWHLVLIDDASPDDRVRPFLRDWAAARDGRATLIELDDNHGFVGAVNRGFAVAETRTGHVILLNSDAMVPPGWAARLTAPFEGDAKIASVTPMSNDAEIFSAPMIGQASQVPAGLVDRIDAVALSLSLPGRLPSAPTGVGFCMALSADWFARVPRFDTAFGRGYGEEVDWCQKTRKAGGRHVAAPNLFVEHRGGQSFGGDLKKTLMMRANAVIARRYPAYDVEVQAFIGRDPLRTPRLALAVAMAGYLSPDALPIYLAHSLGGGAEHALEVEIATRTGQGQSALVLRVGGPDRWQLEVHGPGGVVAGTTADLSLIRGLLAPVPQLRIVYSCGVGDRDPVALPDALLSLRRPGRDDRLEARVHDYFMISPSYCLLDAEGRFRGPVTADATDLAHRARRPDGRAVDVSDWQAAWRRMLVETDPIIVFSESSRDLMVAAYPELSERITYRPHALIARVGPVAVPDGTRETVAVLGNLNRQKGAQVLCALAERMGRRADRRLVLIGNMDTAFSLPPWVQLHGGYAPDEISMLAERYGVTAWLVPSIWPETFSFVTHEVLATGLPVYGFGIGAQGEALARAPNGIAIPFDPDGDHAAAILAALDASAGSGRACAPDDIRKMMA